MYVHVCTTYNTCCYNTVVLLCRLHSSLTVRTAESVLYLVNLYNAWPQHPWNDKIPGTEDHLSYKRSVPVFYSITVCGQQLVMVTVVSERHHWHCLTARITTDRLLTACEMILHPEYYDTLSPSCLLKANHIEIPDVQHAIADVVTDRKDIELLHLYAISSALDVTIQSYAPPTAVLGLATSPYTVLIAGTTTDIKLSLIHI